MVRATVRDMESRVLCARQTVLGLIPARGGSKGIPRKNLRRLAERPLLAYSADAARGSRRITRVVLSTDDNEIAAIGESCGLEVPFARPTELAGDSTSMLAVVEHALVWFLDKGEKFDAVCILQPTSPLRSSETIDLCIEQLWESNADSVVTVRPVPTEFNPHWVYFKTDDGWLKLSTQEKEPIPSRQQLPSAYHRDGSVFVVRTDVVLNERSLYGSRTAGVISPAGEACDLDTEEQWLDLERRLESKPIR